VARRELRIEDVRTLLQKRCKQAGGQSAFAREHGVSRQYIWDVLAGNKPPHTKLCKALGIEPAGMRWVNAKD
jgi:hypothetical protein